MNQKRLCEEDAALMGVTHVSDSQNIYLPASFLGSCHWATGQISDSLAVSKIWPSNILHHYDMQYKLA